MRHRYLNSVIYEENKMKKNIKKKTKTLVEKSENVEVIRSFDSIKLKFENRLEHIEKKNCIF